MKDEEGGMKAGRAGNEKRKRALTDIGIMSPD
jgi:hypothetical protein